MSNHGLDRNTSLSATGADARPLVPEANRRVRLNDVDRMLEGYLDLDEDAATCDGEVTCASVIHRDDCAVVGDPLRARGSLRAHRIA